MSASRKGVATQSSKTRTDNKVVHIYQVRPELALEHLKRTTGLEFDTVPESLVHDREPVPHSQAGDCDPEPPILTDVVDRR